MEKRCIIIKLKINDYKGQDIISLNKKNYSEQRLLVSLDSRSISI